ncbi:hypothetical protein [Psychrobacillus sp. MER TA 171]|uniref:hypothetical protein n=1 Tax=Psychrobacillus sp. MER TA 171 TaxID=2939577 RepID=UPI0020405119|nr:hypothetical protein [Psychrobacillus sp. MER TA 171]MCM3358666.1 hypothetical protein [Psychrobacillus sp. MER TA 171]
MKKYICNECGEEFSKNQLDSELLKDGESFCKGCANSLIEAGRDFEDPDNDFDWDED